MKLDRQMVEYLIGSLPDAEREKIQERLFVDEECWAAMQQTEADLLDAWARGALDEQDRVRLEGLLNESPAERERAAFALALARKTAAPRRQWLRLALAAAAMLAILAVFFFQPQRPQVARRHTPVVMAITIWPGTLRSGSAVQSFHRTPNAERIRLTLPAEGLRAGVAATVSVSTEAGSAIQELPTAVSQREGLPLAECELDAARLPAGAYRVLVRQSGEVAADFRFTLLP